MGLFDNMKDMAEKAKESQKNVVDFSIKTSTESVAKEAATHLLEGEVVIIAQRHWNDWACVTNKRVMFVEKEGLFRNSNHHSIVNVRRKELLSIPFSSILEVNIDFGGLLGEVKIVTKNKTHELRLGKEKSQQFANEILIRIL